MKKSKSLYCIIATCVLLFSICYFYYENQTEPTKRIVVLPLDKRPVNTHFLKELADIQNAKLFFPDSDYFNSTGKERQIYLENWIKGLDEVDGAIISADGMFFGGLLQSRELENVKYYENETIFLEYIEAIKMLKEKNPEIAMTIYKVIPRLTTSVYKETDLPTYHHYYKMNTEFDKYYFKNKKNANKPGLNTDKEGLSVSYEDYIQTRGIHSKISKKLIDMQEEGIFHELIFSQDDSASTGMQIFDQSLLKSYVKKQRVENVHFTNGTDEIDHVLLQKILKKNKPKVYVEYSSKEGQTNKVAFEGKTVMELVEEKSALYEFVIVNEESRADIILYIHNPNKATRDEMALIEDETVKYLTEQLNAKKHISIVDFAFSDSTRQLAPLLIEKGLLNKKISYSSWNTASNTFGLSLSQSIIYFYSDYFAKNKEQEELLVYRLLKDYYYKSIHSKKIRPSMEERQLDAYGDERITDYYPYLLESLSEDLQEIKSSFLDSEFFSTNEVNQVKGVNAPFLRLFEIDFTLE